jgi:hypothetical protein
MKAYIVTTSIVPGATTFCASQADCASARKALVDQEVKRKDIDTLEVDVPTTKAELLDFLNMLVRPDGGPKIVAAHYALTK